MLSLAAGLYGAWSGLGGRACAATLTAFCVLLFVMLLCAARGVTDQISARLGPAAGILLGATLLLAYLIYTLGTNTFAFGRAAVVLALIFVPLAIAAPAGRSPARAWQDLAVVTAVWVAVKFSPARWLWPYPRHPLALPFPHSLSAGTKRVASHRALRYPHARKWPPTIPSPFPVPPSTTN